MLHVTVCSSITPVTTPAPRLPQLSSARVSAWCTDTLNFLKCNLSDCSLNVKASAYLTMIRSQMEYASVIWDPYYISDRDTLESIQ